MTIYLTKKLLHSILLISIGMIPFLLKKKSTHTQLYTYIHKVYKDKHQIVKRGQFWRLINGGGGLFLNLTHIWSLDFFGNE